MVMICLLFFTKGICLYASEQLKYWWDGQRSEAAICVVQFIFRLQSSSHLQNLTFDDWHLQNGPQGSIGQRANFFTCVIWEKIWTLTRAHTNTHLTHLQTLTSVFQLATASQAASDISLGVWGNALRPLENVILSFFSHPPFGPPSLSLFFPGTCCVVDLEQMWKNKVLNELKPGQTLRHPLWLLHQTSKEAQWVYKWINSRMEPSTERYGIICSGQVCCYGEVNDWLASRLQCSLPKTACLHARTDNTHTHTQLK